MHFANHRPLISQLRDLCTSWPSSIAIKIAKALENVSTLSKLYISNTDETADGIAIALIIMDSRGHQLPKKVYGFRNLWISSKDFTDFSYDFTSKRLTFTYSF